MLNQKGFTLIEILLVIVIIGIISGMVIPRVVGRAGQAREKIARTDIEAGLAEALDLYELDTGVYPASLEDLMSNAASRRGWSGPYLKKKNIPKDPWGNAYIYKYPGVQNAGGYDLLSAGPDGVEGGEDDIVNWESN